MKSNRTPQKMLVLGAAFGVVTAFSGSPTLAQEKMVGFDRGSFGNVILNNTQSASGDYDFETAIGNYNNESIRNYSEVSIFAKMGRAVGRLDILTDGGIFPCTAFIVDEKHVLTNYHCVPGILDNEAAGATRIDAVQFVAGYTQQGVEEGTKKYIVSPTPVEAHKDLDYALLEVIGDPSAEFGKLALAGATPTGGDPYWIIGHPMGEAQRISREKCKANLPALSNDRLLHTCDTLPGNSGSPVIDASLQMVVALHHAGSKKDSVNFAVPMGLILERSEYLLASADSTYNPDPPENDPPKSEPDPLPKDTKTETDICDALYAEAKGYAACYAYKAYADQCSGHPFIGFARGYIADNCNGGPVVNNEPDPDPIKPDGGGRKNNDEVVDNGETNPPEPVPTNLRPWCWNGNLNLTERTICGNVLLAGLDQDLESAYSRAKARYSNVSQSSWLKNERNACGAAISCLSRRYNERISYLNDLANQPVVVAPATNYTKVPGNYRQPDYRCYITVASRTSVQLAYDFIRTTLRDTSQVRMFQSDNGYFAITYREMAKSDADWQIAQWVSQGLIPSDSFCASGRQYHTEIFNYGLSGNSGGTGGGNPAPPRETTMWVDNNNDGGLNVRRGPSTAYADFMEIKPGTQVTVMKTQGKWGNIRLQNGTKGWVYMPLLASSKPNVTQCWGSVVNLEPRNYYNTNTGAGFLSVRTKPNTKTGKKITEVYLGDRVKILARRNGWARLQCVSGGCQNPYLGSSNMIGWSSMKYLNIRCN